MLERTRLGESIIAYQSPLLRGLGVPHAFGTRHGDADQLAGAIGLTQHAWVTVKQVHGSTVARGPRDGHPPSCTEADAVMLDAPGHATRIVTADCVPIFLVSTDGRRVAAIHAGWRGLVAGVIERAADQLGARFLAAVGPCISAAHFEVGPEVAQHFDPAHHRTPPGHKPHIDLAAAAAARLKALGAQAIDCTDRCTYRDAKDFYSHRRDVTHGGAATTGRLSHLIAPKR
ncbi:MAG: polyphenol oxidase family protein [Phycisphaerales bacterium JB063]